MFIGGLCWLTNIALAFIGLADNEGFAIVLTVIDGVWAFSGLLILVGPYLCITVPEKTGAKQMAIVSATAQTIGIIATFALFFSVGRGVMVGKVDPTEIVMLGAIMFAGYAISGFTFVQFLKLLARFLGDKDAAGSAETVIMIFTLQAFCTVLAFVMPMVASSMEDMAWLGMVSFACLITASIGGFIAFFMYVGVIEKLNKLLSGKR